MIDINSPLTLDVVDNAVSDIVEIEWYEIKDNRPEKIRNLWDFTSKHRLTTKEFVEGLERLVESKRADKWMPRIREMKVALVGKNEKWKGDWGVWERIEDCGKCHNGILRVAEYEDLVLVHQFVFWCDCDKALKHPQYDILPLLKHNVIKKRAIADPHKYKIIEYAQPIDRDLIPF